MSDGDSENKTIKRQKQKTNIVQRVVANAGDVLSAIWLRCAFQIDNGFKRVLLDCRRRILFNFRVFLVILYITYTIFK
jgi:hypothetical protein